MRILLLAPRLPYPIDNGEDLRVYHFARYFSARHDLEFAGYATGGDNPAATLFRRLHTLPPPAESPVRARRSISATLRSLSPHDIFASDDRLRALLDSLLARESFDLLWTPSWNMVPIACSVRRPPLFVDVMDDGVLEQLREVLYGAGLRGRAVGLKRLLQTLRFERTFLGQAALCCFVSEQDATAFRRCVTRRGRVAVIPNGVDLEYYAPQSIEEEESGLVFEGNMAFGPNVDAVIHFCRAIFPKIASRLPDVTLTVVGKDPHSSILALAGPRVRVTGTVADVRPYVARAAVFVCAMRKGAGIKNKILQAWAMGKAVVATPTSCGGLRYRDGENIRVASSPSDFADAVVELLNDEGRRRTIGREARATVEAHYSWARRGAELEQCFEVVARSDSEARGRPAAAEGGAPHA